MALDDVQRTTLTSVIMAEFGVSKFVSVDLAQTTLYIQLIITERTLPWSPRGNQIVIRL